MPSVCRPNLRAVYYLRAMVNSDEKERVHLQNFVITGHPNAHACEIYFTKNGHFLNITPPYMYRTIMPSVCIPNLRAVY